MKIVHIAEYLPSIHNRFGGAEQAAQKIINLTSKEHEVYIFTSYNQNKEAPDKTHLIKSMDVYFGKAGILFTLIIPFDLISYRFSLKKLKEIKPDILHIHKFDRLSLSMVSAAKKLGIPVVFSVYDYLLFCPTAMLLKPDNSVCKDYRSNKCKDCIKSKKGGFVRNIFLGRTNRMFKKYSSKIDHFIVLSESSKKILMDNGISNEKISIIYLPFDKLKHKTRKIEKNSILYVGWLEPHKGLHILIDAMPKVIKKFKYAKLYVIGNYTSNPSYHSRIKDMITRLGLEDKVTLLGKKNADEVNSFLNKAEVVVIPEQWENMSPLFLIESMANEKPIVTSRIGGIPEFIKDGKNGYLVDPESPSAFADRIILLLRNRKKARYLGMNAGKDFSRIFASKSILENLIKTYNLVRNNER